jgi:hypothetical protein
MRKDDHPIPVEGEMATLGELVDRACKSERAAGQLGQLVDVWKSAGARQRGVDGDGDSLDRVSVGVVDVDRHGRAPPGVRAWTYMSRDEREAFASLAFTTPSARPVRSL